jgi:hypothetical protein
MSTFSEKKAVRGSVPVPVRAADGASADAQALTLMSGPGPDRDIRTDY